MRLLLARWSPWQCGWSVGTLQRWLDWRAGLCCCVPMLASLPGQSRASFLSLLNGHISGGACPNLLV